MRVVVLERKNRSDSASSVVIGFVLLLILAAAVLGIWAATGLPAQMKEMDKHTFRELERSFLQYKLAADTLRVQNSCGTVTGILFPDTRGITFCVTTDTGGRLSITTDDDFGNTTICRIGKVSLRFSGVSGLNADVSYEAGGVHTKTGGNDPAWITPALMQISPTDQSTARVEIVIISFAGDAEISGSGNLPVMLTLRESGTRTLYWKDNATIRFHSPDAKQQELWETMFFETKERTVRSDVVITQPDPLTLRLETSGNLTSSEILLREAVYETGPAEILYA